MSMNFSAVRKPETPMVRGQASAADPRPAALTADLRALHQLSTRIRFTRGETIFGESDDETHAYKIVSGVVRLCKYTLDGRRQIIDFMLPGDFFGFSKRNEYGVTAEAVSDTVLLSFPRKQIERLEATAPGVQKHMNALMSDWVMSMQHHIVVLGCQTAKERIASFLLRLQERAGVQAGERLDLSMGRQDIADHLGLTIETVCRALSELKREGVIGIPNVHQIAVTDTSALYELAEGGPRDEEYAPMAPNPVSHRSARHCERSLLS